MATLTVLDEHLYAWLAEADDRRFEAAFRHYFVVAFPAVIRHLARVSRFDPALLEELAQETLIRFFDRIGRARREASERVREALTSVRPLNFGPLHCRQVTAWTTSIREFREMATSYQPPPESDSARTEWKSWINEFAAKIPPLQQQGIRLVGMIRVELRWSMDDAPLADAPAKSDLTWSEEPTPPKGSAPLQSNFDDERLFVDEIKAKTPRVIATEIEHPGLSSFVIGSCEIVDQLPRLRIPTNGYLFEIATTIYVDECKKLSRLKRGGNGASGYTEAPTYSTLSQESPEGDDGTASLIDPVGAYLEPADFQFLSLDPISTYENVDLFEKFHAFLRKPLDDAIANLVTVEKRGRALAERRRVESLSYKFQRTMAILTLVGEGNTQEEIGAQMGLSRNQVKYVVEEVQKAYEAFQDKTAIPQARSSNVVATDYGE